MSSVSLVKRALENFNSGDYASALQLYEQAAYLYKSQAFKVNIELCKKKLNSKIAEKKGRSYLNEYFDHVYVVNLKHEVAKRLKIVNQLNKSFVLFELVEATNGYVGEPRKKYEEYFQKPLGNLKRYSEFNQLELKRGSKFIESAGAIGYIYTYLSILRDAKQKGYKKFLILEDDIILSKDFEYKLERFVANINNDWKVLQLGASQYGWDSLDLNEAETNGYYLPRRLDTCGSFAIAFDSSVIDEIIEAQQAFEAPFDHLPMGEIYEKYNGQCFVAYPNIIMPDVGDSSIRGGRCQYTHSQRVRWNVDNYRYPYPRPTVAVILSSAKNLKYFANFSNHAETAVELRLYYLSSDGLRPLHNKDMVSPEYKANFSSLSSLSMPEVDFCLTLGERDILTETDITNCVEYLLGLIPNNHTPLRSIDIPQVKHKLGRVSVIIPTYKRPKNLKNALMSVLDQDYQDLEILVVSDNGEGSEFNIETSDLIEKLKEDYPNRNLKLIEHTKNRNGAAARNTGIMQSTGEYICFLDDDDIYLPSRIKNGVGVLEKSRGIDGGVYCGFLGWNSPTNDLCRYKSGDLTLEILLLDYKKHYLHTNTATYKREAVMAINGFDESYRRHQDLEFNLRFFELYTIDVVAESGVRLNPEPSDISNKIKNIEMIKLKEKFLSQFEGVILKFGKQEEAIYQKHWDEASKYMTDKYFFESAKTQFKNSWLQIKLKMEV